MLSGVGENKTVFFRQKLELILFLEEPALISTVMSVVSLHHLSCKTVKPSEGIEGVTRIGRPQVIFLHQSEDELLGTLSKRINDLQKLLPKAAIIAVVNNASMPAALEWVPHPQVLILSPREFSQTRKLEYLLLAKTRAQYFDISLSDLFSMTTIPFNASLRLTLNQKYLAVIFRNAVLLDQKVSRLEKTPSLYVGINETQAFRDYVLNFNDTSGRGLKKRVRSLFLDLVSKVLSMNEYLLFDIRALEEAQLKQKYADLVGIAERLIDAMHFEGDLWDVLREGLDNELIQIWRDPLIATYAALLCVKSQQGNPLHALLGGLWADLGLWDLSAELHKKYIVSGPDGLADERAYQEHVMSSLNRCLFKRLPLPEEVKTLIVCTHERADGKGFPNQTPADKIPFEAWTVQLAEQIDFGVRTMLAETGVSFRFVREKIWEKEQEQKNRFPAEFLAKISESLL